MQIVFAAQLPSLLQDSKLVECAKGACVLIKKEKSQIMGKIGSLHGLWAEGRREEGLQYVGQDARTTLDLATTCEPRGELRWIARSGKLRSMALPEGWLTVEEAGRLPLPNTSWMDEPWSREEFTGWMG